MFYIAPTRKNETLSATPNDVPSNPPINRVTKKKKMPRRQYDLDESPYRYDCVCVTPDIPYPDEDPNEFQTTSKHPPYDDDVPTRRHADGTFTSYDCSLCEPPPPPSVAPEPYSAEAFLELKHLRSATRDRKMVRKGSGWRTKQAMKDPMVFWDYVFHDERHAEEARVVRPGMTMRVRGGWEVKLDDNGAAVEEEEEVDWVAEVQRRPVEREVSMSELLTSAKRGRSRKKGQLFKRNHK